MSAQGQEWAADGVAAATGHQPQREGAEPQSVRDEVHAKRPPVFVIVASRRKYRTPQAYRDGGRVSVDDAELEVAPDASPAAPEAPPERVATRPAEEPVSTEDAVLRALQGTQRAEELARQAQQPADPVDRMQGLSDRQRSFLKQNRVLLRDDIAPIAGEHYQAALKAGIPDDSYEIERYILEKTAQQLEQRRKLREASPVMDDRDSAPAYDPETRRQAMLLEREAEMLAEPPEPMTPPPIPRRSIQYSAPVSRDIPSVSTGRAQSASSQVTLSAAEREIARNSFSDPSMSDADRELSYARQKLKIARLKASGAYE